MSTNNVLKFNTKVSYKERAIELLRRRDDERYYIMNYLWEGCDDPMPYIKPLTKEQLEEVKAILAVCKAEEIDICSYFVERDTDAPEFMTVDDPDVYHIPESIELETVYRQCPIKLAIFHKGLSEAPTIIETHIYLTEEELVSLIEWQANNRHGGYNDLASSNYKLFKSLNERIRDGFSQDWISPIATPTFTVELTGLREAAEEICGEPEVGCGVFYASDGIVMEQSFISIKDRELMFCYQKTDSEDLYISSSVSNVDAIAVQEALGVTSYKELIEVVQQRFGDRDGVDNFIKFITEQGIEGLLAD